MSRINDIVAKYEPWVDHMGEVICKCIENGDVTPNFQPLQELEILLDLLDNYADCLTPEMVDCYEDRLQDIVKDCDQIIIIPPVDPTACPDDAIVTEDTADCLITEDTGDFILIE